MPELSAQWPIIGHQGVVSYFQRCIRNDTVGHAYLLVGPAQVGKTTIAQHFAAALLCREGRRGYACEECPSCRLRTLGVHPDFHRLAPQASGRGVLARPVINLEDVRGLISRLGRRPLASARTVAVVVGAEKLNHQAANAMLKTVEEPGGRTVLIFTCDTPAQLPQTLRSRCLSLRLSPVAVAHIAAALQQQGLPRSAALPLATLAGGRPGRALVFTQQPDLREAFEAEVARFEQLLGQGVHERLLVAAELFARDSGSENSSAVESLGQRFEIWLTSARDQLLAAAGCGHLRQWTTADSLPSADAEAVWQWRFFIDTLRDLRAALRQNVSPRFVFEVAMLALP